jgi:hypothetical protein
MGLPGHRRTSSDKRRRASHFALKKQPLAVTGGVTHVPHRLAPGATEYNGHVVHVKGQKRKLEKLLKTKKTRTAKTPDHAKHAHE